ncbi:MAG TPA: CBS domain-containing protein [Rhizomicrobium sp.]|nr:CBS domain-containing protein [Rhizomicrobium sp.]
MKIRTILERKQPGVVTINMLSTLKVAAELMARRRIAALVVTEDGKPVGLLSERHIVEVFAREGKLAEEMRIRQILDRQLTAISPDDSIKRAMSLMTDNRLRHLPVMNENELVGIVSLGDLVKQRLLELELEANVLRDIYIAAH